MSHQVITSTVLAKADWEEVLRIWNNVYPVEIQMLDSKALQDLIETTNCKHYTLRNDAAKIEAWMSVFDRYDTRWFSILVAPETQGRGLGKSLIVHAQSVERCLEGWVVQSDKHLRADGQVYMSPLAFYRKLGFRQNPNRFTADGLLDVICVKWESDSYASA